MEWLRKELLYVGAYLLFWLIVYIALIWIPRHIYKVECKLFVKQKRRKGEFEKCLGSASKKIFALTPRDAVAKTEGKLKREIEENLRKQLSRPRFRLNKIPAPNQHRFEWFVDGKQF